MTECTMLRITIEQCREQAIELRHQYPIVLDHPITFHLCGEGGKIVATWLDPHFGLFQTEGSNGHMSVSSVPSHLWCENLAVGGSREIPAIEEQGPQTRQKE
jgi:hypothetical protein